MKRPISQNIHKYDTSDRYQKSIHFPHYMINEQSGCLNTTCNHTCSIQTVAGCLSLSCQLN